MDDYIFSLITPEDASPDYYYIELKPKEHTASVWGRIVATVRKADYIPVKQVYYDEKDRKMREQIFKEISDFDGRKLPAVMEMVPVNKKGHKTIIRYSKARFDLKLPKDTFTLRNLQKRR